MATEQSHSKNSKEKSFDWDKVGGWALQIGVVALQAAVGGIAMAAGGHAYDSLARGRTSGTNADLDLTVVPMKRTNTV